MDIVVIGGGAFGTAVSAVISSTVSRVTLLVRDIDQMESINKHRCNTKYLPDYRLPKNCIATVNRDCIEKADAILLAVPARMVERVCHDIKPLLASQAIVINLAKGLHDRFLTLDAAMSHALPDVNIGSLKGPNFSRPLLFGYPSGMTLALKDPASLTAVTEVFNGSSIQIETWSCVADVEFVSALKNVLAIVMGISDAIEENPNTRFMVMQKMINEARSLLDIFGYDSDVLFTYAGLGDLLMTALNDVSRNRTLGLLVGRGFEFASAANGPVLEGRRTIGLICAYLQKKKISHALMSGLEAVFSQSMSPQEYYKQLTSPLKKC